MMTQIPDIPLPEGLFLRIDENGLYLTDGNLTVRGDFSQMAGRARQSNLEHEMLVKAARIKGSEKQLLVIDATAGLGEDSFLLAAAGFQVIMYESDPVIAALLRDALMRAGEDEDLKEIAGRMQLIEGDSIAALKAMAAIEHEDEKPDVVYLDPMFPERQKSALIKKKFQLLQRLERPCSNGEELLAAAFAADPRRIVVKRPLKGPFLADKKPSYSLKGKAIRYDCFVIARATRS